MGLPLSYRCSLCVNHSLLLPVCSWMVILGIELTVLASLGLHLVIAQKLTNRMTVLNQALEAVKKSQATTQKLHIRVQKELLRAQFLLEGHTPASSNASAVMPLPGWGPRRGLGAPAAVRPRPTSLYEVPV